MKFGPVPLDQALGGILAHSIGLTNGRLRKGLELQADHIAALGQAGLAEVTIARLEEGDIPEAQAAQRLAVALVPDPAAAGLSLTRPTNGRVNIVAEGPGLAALDADRLRAVNRLDPMISLATVPHLTQMRTKGLVATVKIISYAVPDAILTQAEEAGHAAIRLLRPQLKSAALLVTDVPGGPGDKGTRAIADRVSALGATLDTTRRVPHQIVDVSDALTEMARARPDVFLILTGSATSDVDDTAPAALRAAGGTVIRFGMPVDPGNLLFLGELQGIPVIGLPGCARSPALNGADWILARILCGVPVTSDDIADMGVGGLLKEIPTRPMPRRENS